MTNKKTEILKSILFFPWTLWCLLSLTITMLLFYPFLVLFVYIGKPSTLKFAYQFPHIISVILLRLWCIRVVVHNKVFSKQEGQFIFIGNHMSYLDALILGQQITHFVKWLGKAEVLNYPGFGFVLKHLHIAVNREDKESRVKVIERMKKELKSGAGLLIMPEGTCNTSGNLTKEFHDGAFRLSIEHQLPILPITITHAAQLMPRSLTYIKPGTVHVYWHEIVKPKNYSVENLDPYKEEIRKIFEDDLKIYWPSGKY